MARVRLFPKNGSGLERFVRTLALLAVFAGVIWFYQRHFDRALERSEERL